jgi:hypothetical protein
VTLKQVRSETLSAVADRKTAHPGGPRLLYDRKEAARQLSISVRSLDYFLAQRKFDTRRIGKKVLITHASLVRFSQANHYEGVLAPRTLSEPLRQISLRPLETLSSCLFRRTSITIRRDRHSGEEKLEETEREEQETPRYF